jgi:hypothetical protein
MRNPLLAGFLGSCDCLRGSGCLRTRVGRRFGRMFRADRSCYRFRRVTITAAKSAGYDTNYENGSAKKKESIQLTRTLMTRAPTRRHLWDPIAGGWGTSLPARRIASRRIAIPWGLLPLWLLLAMPALPSAHNSPPGVDECGTFCSTRNAADWISSRPICCRD